MAYIFLSFSDPILYFLSFHETKESSENFFSVWKNVSSPGHFWQVAGNLFYGSSECKTKTVGTRSLRSDVSMPFADCWSNCGTFRVSFVPNCLLIERRSRMSDKIYYSLEYTYVSNVTPVLRKKNK